MARIIDKALKQNHWNQTIHWLITLSRSDNTPLYVLTVGVVLWIAGWFAITLGAGNYDPERGIFSAFVGLGGMISGIILVAVSLLIWELRLRT